MTQTTEVPQWFVFLPVLTAVIGFLIGMLVFRQSKPKGEQGAMPIDMSDPIPVRGYTEDVQWGTVEPPIQADPPRVLFGKTCFAEYTPKPDYGTQKWEIGKYASDWSFRLEREEDVVEMMARLDGFASAVLRNPNLINRAAKPAKGL